MYFSRGESQNITPISIQQNEQITFFPNPRVYVDVWISQVAYANPHGDAASHVTNGTFDINLSGWNAGGVPEHPLYTGTIARDIADPQAGAGCLLVTCNALGLAGVNHDFDPPIKAGHSYELRYWHKRGSVPPQKVRATATFYDSGFVQVGSLQLFKRRTAGNVYTQHREYVYIPTNATYIRVHFLVEGNAGDTMRIDEVEFEEVYLPKLRVRDHGGTDYYETPPYDGEGWFSADVSYQRTGDNVQIEIEGNCHHGTVVVDNVRIE
jgi:hypothetical protein